MRILHILNTGKFSGAENVVCQIIKMYKDDKNFCMSYCSFDGPIRDTLEEKGVAFYPVVKMSASEIKRVMNLFQPDVIHAHDMKAGLTAARACGKTRLISHIHNNAFNSRRLSPKTIAYFMAAKKAESIIWVSKSSFDGYAFSKVFSKKSVVLYNVIDQDELHDRMKADSNEYVYDVVYIGRITYQKNPQRLIKILRKTCNLIPELKVAIIGTGEDDDEVNALSSQMNLDENVTFLGFQKNPSKILYDSKVMVMTSRWEGTPMVALEAIALGVPIISTPTDGMNELIEDGINGYLTEDDNRYVELIAEVVQNKELHDRLSEMQLGKSKVINDTDAYKKTLDRLYKRSVK